MNSRAATALSLTSTPEHLAARAQENPLLLRQLVDGMDADTARVKFGCAKALRLLATRHPELLYPCFDRFAGLLDHKNKILLWQGSIILSYLTSVDTDEKFTAIFDRYFSVVPGPVMITAANVISGSARIARAKPALADRIAGELLKVQHARYATSECRNVNIGHTITALGDFFDLLRNPAPALDFVSRQLNNRRPATRKKAERFLRRHRKPGRER